MKRLKTCAYRRFIQENLPLRNALSNHHLCLFKNIKKKKIKKPNL